MSFEGQSFFSLVRMGQRVINAFRTVRRPYGGSFSWHKSAATSRKLINHRPNRHSVFAEQVESWKMRRGSFFDYNYFFVCALAPFMTEIAHFQNYWPCGGGCLSHKNCSLLLKGGNRLGIFLSHVITKKIQARLIK